MSKRAAFFAVIALSLLVSGSVFAAEAPISTQAFLASLQASGTDSAAATPADLKIGNEPAPTFLSVPSCAVNCCDYSCKKCTTTSVKLCAFNHCTGQSGCDPCHSGTTCSF